MPMPQRLGQYQIEDLLGEGSFAWVYRAFDEKFEQYIALKLLKPIWLSDPQAIARFKQEARTARQLRHPHIIDVYDIGEADGQVYLAQLLVEGEDLARRLAGGPLAWDEVTRIVTDIGLALDYAHSEGIIHRDIKPSNILLGKGDKAFLGDFGLVRAVEGSASLSSSGAMIGTGHYMAPEVWDEKAATPATDVYALSCVVFEMLTGEVLFDGSSMMAVLKKHADGPQLPATWPPGTPTGVNDVLKRGLAQEPAERIRSAGELAAQLVALSAPAEVTSPSSEVSPTTKPVPEPAPPQLVESKLAPAQRRAFPKLPGWVWGTGGLLVLVGVIGLGLWAVGARQDSIAATATTDWLVLDSDGDGLTNGQEIGLQTDPLKQDTDFDGVGDEEEILQGLNPLSRDTDGDGLPDDVDPDPRQTPTSTSPVPTGMVLVPAGPFEMGSDRGQKNEKPVHTVTLDEFYIDQYEVTNADFRQCVEAGTCQAPTACDFEATYEDETKEHHPVVCIGWNQAKTYCEWREARLPTEAEWEKAARGTDGQTYPWGEGIDCDKANYGSCVGNTTEVGTHQSGVSPYGAYDMAGNVWEWVADGYTSDYYSEASSENPTGPGSFSSRVLRGGSWNSSSFVVRAADRLNFNPAYTSGFVGFRCAR